MTPQETFVTRLRRHRERSRIALDDIAATTRIKRELLDAFERGDLTKGDTPALAIEAEAECEERPSALDP